MFDDLQILSNTTKHKHDQTAPTRCPNGKMFGHQTMFDVAVGRQTFSVCPGL